MTEPTRTIAESASSDCFHCGQPVPAGLNLVATIDGVAQPMCCHGCKAVAEAIVDAGCTDFYRMRDGVSPTGADLIPEILRRDAVYDRDDVQAAFVRESDDHLREAALILEGITCAACVWLNEQHVAKIPGVRSFQVNYATHRARLVWDPGQVHLSDVLNAVRAIGYEAHPYNPEQQQALFERERKQQLQRIGVAGVLGAQVMMLSVTLYFGDWSGMDERFARLFRWIAFFLTVPVLLYSARPFYTAAWRDLRKGMIGMDVPVSLGIAIAFGGSLWTLYQGHGHVYFDSVTMFTFFLLVSRYFELMARKQSAEQSERIARSLPAVATRLVVDESGEHEEVVAIADLQCGDRILVRPGDSIPADGEVLSGHSSIDESLLTGESVPCNKLAGDKVIAGSVNMENPIQVTVRETGQETVLSEILRLMDRAQADKPATSELADRVASRFVTAVLIGSCIVGGYWWLHDPAAMLPIVVAVLVVTCPCALSLATPTAIAAASGALLSRGLLLSRGAALESLSRIDHVVFDKTGTLTRGLLDVTDVIELADVDREEILGLAAALESRSEHPIARAIRRCAPPVGQRRVGDVINEPGRGIHGQVNGEQVSIGTPEWVGGISSGELPARLLESFERHGSTLVALARGREMIGIIALQDELRPEASRLVSALRADGIQVSLLSGDQPRAVERVAGELGIVDASGGLLPADKLDRVNALQSDGHVVGMIGDGINDAPVLGAADVSIAMGSAARLAQIRADLILVSDQLERVSYAFHMARRTLRVIHQNLGWALTYNVVALPLAAAGYVQPWMAALGMSFSSLLVVANALRLRR